VGVVVCNILFRHVIFVVYVCAFFVACLDLYNGVCVIIIVEDGSFACDV